MAARQRIHLVRIQVSPSQLTYLVYKTYRRHRPTSDSIRASIASLSYLHNQTVNVYSHLVGAIISIILPVYFYQFIFKTQLNARLADLILVSVYCFGVAVCFAFSVT